MDACRLAANEGRVKRAETSSQWRDNLPHGRMGGTGMDHETFMRVAIALADKNVATGSGGPFGAVVVQNGRIIGKGTNSVTRSNDPTAHAEVVAIRRACLALNSFSLKGCTIYTNCEPCPMCLSAIYWAGLDRIYYGNTRSDAARIGFDDARIYREVSRPTAERAIPTERLLGREAIKAFEDWSGADIKIPY